MQQPGVPLYLKLAATLKSRILSRAYPPGGWIPAAKDLAQEFGVSTITVRKAVELLTREGYLAARQGAGTLARLPELKKMEIQISGDFRGWLDSASGIHPRLEVEILDLSPFQPPERIRTILGIGRDEPVGRLRRQTRHRLVHDSLSHQRSPADTNARGNRLEAASAYGQPQTASTGRE